VPLVFDDSVKEMICLNFCCRKEFKIGAGQSVRKKDECLFHPKAFDIGSWNGKWEESWQCCGKLWGGVGCTKGYHYGVEKRFYKERCTNMGEGFSHISELVKPWKGCYKLYGQGEKDEKCDAFWHAGDFDESKKKWYCCGKEGIYSKGC
jgi:hypothetical protein